MLRSIAIVVIIFAAACGATQQGSKSTGAVAYEPMDADHAPSAAMDDAAAAIEGAATSSVELALPIMERPPHPFVDVSEDELERLLLNQPADLGSISVGFASSGAQFGAVQMPKNPRWKVVNARETWGTTETVGFISLAIDRVNEQFPNTLPLHIGDISGKGGGHLSPHVSHQSGRDVDLGYYYTTPEAWYTTAGAKNLDLPRTWALVRSFVTETDVEYLFIDNKIQAMLREHALAAGEPADWVNSLFDGGPSGASLIRHEPGHDTHIHVRFYNPIAQETGRRVYRLLVKHDKISPPTYFVQHKVKKGESLNLMAKKHKTTVKAIQRANGLKNTRIIAGRTYKIPKQGGVKPPARSARIPDRRLPGAATGTTMGTR